MRAAWAASRPEPAGQRVDGVVLGGGVDVVEVVAVGEDARDPLPRGLDQRLRALPGLDDDVLRQVGVQDLFPAHHLLAVLGEDGGHPAVEVRLQRVVVGEALLALEGGDALALVPVLAVVLVAADVEVRVGEERRHLAQEAVEEGVDLFLRRVEGGVEDPPLVLDAVRAGQRGQLGMPDEPARHVAGHVELRHHADAARGGVGDDLAELVLRVVLAVRPHLVQPRMALALHAEALVLGEVPVQDVQLHRRHAVEVALQDLHGHEVPGGIDEQAAPREAGPVLDADAADEVALGPALHELQEGLQPAQRARRWSAPREARRTSRPRRGPRGSRGRTTRRRRAAGSRGRARPCGCGAGGRR